MQIPFTDIELTFYNLFSCSGFEVAEGIGLSFGPCAIAKLGLVILFFINAVVRKWGGEEIGYDYSFFGGLIGGLLSYIITIAIIGNFKISFMVGIIVMLIGGYLGGQIFGGGDDYE